MANFSFGKFFGKNSRQPRFNPTPGEGALGPVEAPESLPVGRLVSFTDDGPEDAPLFQELEGPPASPFEVVGGVRPSMGAGGLPQPARTPVEDGFTADELSALVPPPYVRAGAVSGAQVIPLPPQVLRASLGAGQPAILLSQLHLACPELFLAPSSLDQDLVIALPPQKVQRLVARGPTAGQPMGPPPLPVVFDDALESMGWNQADHASIPNEASTPVFGAPPSKIKLPPPRRKFDEIQGGDLRPMVEPPSMTSFGGPFMEREPVVPPASEAVGAGFASPFQKVEAVASPFQVTSALPSGHSPRGGIPKRYESPFAIVSPGEVPAVLESPFARHPVTGFDVPPVPPAVSDAMPEPMPAPPSTVSLRLSALLHGQNVSTLGFAPERVPASVRVTLPSLPLLTQVASGRIRVSLDEVVAGLEAKFQPAFKGAQPGLELHVPLRELFDNLPEAAPPTPSAPPVDSTFQTPFSVRAEEDKPLTAVNSPFQLAAPVPALAPPPQAQGPAARAPLAEPPFIVIPEIPGSAAAATPDFTPPNAASPFLLLPTETPSQPLPSELAPSIVPPPPLAASLEAPLPTLPAAPPSTLPPPVLAATTSEPLATPPLALPPTQIALPPMRNPFALAPGEGVRAGLGLDMPLMPYDEDPVPLESLREDTSEYRPTSTPFTAAPSQPPVVSSPVLAETAAEPPAVPPVSPLPPVVRLALSEQLPLPPPSLDLAEPQLTEAVAPSNLGVADPLPTEPPHSAVPPAEVAPPATSLPPSSPPIFAATDFQLPPLPFELLSPAPSVATASPATVEALPSVPPPPSEEAPLITPALAEAPPFTVASPSPTADDRAAFAFVFAPSALANAPDGANPPLGEMDSLPAIALAKLPPLGEVSSPERPGTSFIAPPSDTPTAHTPAFTFGPVSPVAPVASIRPEAALSVPFAPVPFPTPATDMRLAAPEESAAVPVAPASTDQPMGVEDLSFGYVDDPTQLALRAVFSTDRTLGTQDVINLAAGLEGLRACLVHTPHASLHSAASPADTDDVRHFRDRAGSLFEKTASLVRELDPSAREQSFTLRTAKGVVSFFAVDDVCLAVLHAEPNFRPGVREKLTLVIRSMAGMLAA